MPIGKAARADRKNPAQGLQGIEHAHLVNPGVFHCDFFAKYAVAFSNISSAIFNRAFSARSRDNAICSAVTGLPVPDANFPD